MDYFNYRNNELYAEDVTVSDIANKYGTPCYIYSKATFERHWRVFDEALSGHAHLICYAVKANSNISILKVLAELGSGFDIVSVGELERVIKAGGSTSKVVFSGVGKQDFEIRRALEVGILSFNVESSNELFQINEIAKSMNTTAPISVRVNPDIDAQTHPYISTGMNDNKFGIDHSEVFDIYRQAAELPHLNIIGIDCHIGSQITTVAPFVEATKKVIDLIKQLRDIGIKLSHLNLGGGLGVRYIDEDPPLPKDYTDAIVPLLKDLDLKIILEPGRAIAANAGIFVTQVLHHKKSPYKSFAIVDGAMNDLIRPALYQVKHDIIPVVTSDHPAAPVDIVGPVCETSDCFGRDYKLAAQSGDLLAIRSAGAYGFTMSSRYNSRPQVAECLVDGDAVHLIRRRESIEDLFEHEILV